MNKTDALHEGLKQMLNYLPMIYNQQRVTKEFDGVYTIKYPYDTIPNNALIFMLPLSSSIADKTNKLVIKHAKVINSEVTYNEVKEYNIMVENMDGTKRPATKGDIIANKLCMFRFITNNNSDIILCNTSMHKDISCTALCVTNKTKFYLPPTVVIGKSISGAEIEDTLVLNSTVDALTKRVEALENKFKVGTMSAEEYFNSNPNDPAGTIYLQVEE